jgi:hypothetical protein
MAITRQVRAKTEHPQISDYLALEKYPGLFAEALGLDPDEWQYEVLESDSKRILLNCARQTGKSSIVAVMALHHALYTPGAMVIVISHTLEQAKESFRKITDYYKQIGRPVLSITESVHRLELQNKSRIIALTGQAPDSIRGYSDVTLLIIDEAAQVHEKAYTNARPMLNISDGKIVLLSTPHGKRGFFWQAWENETEWLKIEINADQCPRFKKAFIMEEKARMLDWEFKQEYYCFFAEAIDSVFRAEDIEAAFNHPELYTRDEINMDLE